MQLVPSSVRVEVDINGMSQASLTTNTKLIYVPTNGRHFHLRRMRDHCLDVYWDPGPLRIQAMLLSIATLFLLASMVPYMLFFCTRSASVKAFVGGSQIPDSAVQSMARSLGVTGEYKSVSYRQC